MTTYLKSVVAGAIAGLAAAVPLAGDGIVLPEWLMIAGAFLAGQQAVYWTPNEPKQGQAQQPQSRKDG